MSIFGQGKLHWWYCQKTLWAAHDYFHSWNERNFDHKTSYHLYSESLHISFTRSLTVYKGPRYHSFMWWPHLRAVIDQRIISNRRNSRGGCPGSSRVKSLRGGCPQKVIFSVNHGVYWKKGGDDHNEFVGDAVLRWASGRYALSGKSFSSLLSVSSSIRRRSAPTIVIWWSILPNPY